MSEPTQAYVDWWRAAERRLGQLAFGGASMSRETYLEACERMLRRILELQRDPYLSTSPLGPTLRDLGLSEMPLREPLEIRVEGGGWVRT